MGFRQQNSPPEALLKAINYEGAVFESYFLRPLGAIEHHRRDSAGKARQWTGRGTYPQEATGCGIHQEDDGVGWGLKEINDRMATISRILAGIGAVGPGIDDVQYYFHCAWEHGVG